MEHQDRPALITLTALAVVGIVPLVVPALQGGPVSLPSEVALAGKTLVFAVMLGILAARSWLDVRQGLWPIWLSVSLIVVAGLMTVLHFYAVDLPCRSWQFDLY